MRAMEVCADAELDVTGASTMAEAAQRTAPDNTQKLKEDKLCGSEFVKKEKSFGWFLIWAGRGSYGDNLRS